MTRRRLAAASLAALVVVLGACADTVIEESTATTAAVDATAPQVDITVPSGTTSELLADLTAAVGALSDEIIADGSDERTILDHVDSVWAVARPDVESTHPELLAGFDTAVEMAHTAVVRIRPADADKAYLLLIDLTDRYDAG